MKRLILILAAAALPLGLLYAGGAGGLTFGIPLNGTGLSNYDLQTMQLGGYGYGVTSGGQRIGGFGLAFFGGGMSSRNLAGGVGGVLSGQEFHAGPLIVAVNLLAGIGGIGTSGLPTPGGYAVLFGEATLEAGVAVFPWMMLAAYGGMQVMTNFVPGRAFSDALYYTPVAGVRASWGSFRDR